MLVVDASAIVKLFIGEPGSGDAQALLTTDEKLIVPAHALAETGEVISRKMKSGFVDNEQLLRILPVLEASFDVVPIAGLLPSAIHMSVETGASVYDCLYVALAASEDCRMVTADRRLVDKLSATRFAALMLVLDSSTGSP